MSWKKNGVTYALWVVYALAAGLLAVLLGIHTGVTYGMELYASALSAGAFVVFLVFLFLVVRKLIAPRLPESMKGWKWAAAEAAAVVLLLAAGLACRILWLSYAGESAAYYDAARIVEGQSLPMVAHGAEYMYLQLLHLVFLFLGNKWMAGIWLQIVLQLVAGVILYLGLRKLSGGLAAVLMLAFWMLSPQQILAGLTYSPVMLYLCIYGTGLLCVASYLRKRASETAWTVYDWVLLFFAGAVVAFVCYLDVTGLTLLLLAVSALWLNKAAGKNIWENAGLQLGALFLGAAAGFAGYLGLDAYGSGKSFGSVFRAWRELYAVKAYDDSFWMVSGNLWVYILLFAMLLLGIFSFWCRKGGEKLSPWVLALLALTGMSYCHMTAPAMDAGLLLYWICTVMAGIAVAECFHRNGQPAAQEQPQNEEEPAAEEELWELGKPAVEEEPQNEEEPAVEEELWEFGKPAAEEEPQKPGKPVAEKQEEKQMQRKQPARITDAETVQKPDAAQEERPRKVKLLDNPLPLPKKHVKKTMDFQYSPQKEELDFDLDVAEDDDYDL